MVAPPLQVLNFLVKFWLGWFSQYILNPIYDSSEGDKENKVEEALGLEGLKKKLILTSLEVTT